MVKWEYFIVKGSLSFKGNLERMEQDLNALGAQGWEAVSQTGDPLKTVYILLKRALA